MTSTWPAQARGGGSDAYLVHAQATPAAVWWITHDLNKFPSVTLLDEDGHEVEADISYPSMAEVVVRWAGNQAGRALLN